MKWTLKIKGVEKKDKIIVHFDLILDGQLFLADSVFIDVSGYTSFSENGVLKAVKEEILKKSYPEIAKENVFQKLLLRVSTTELEFDNANINS